MDQQQLTDSCRRPEANPQITRKPNRITVFVAAHNEEATIGMTLDSMLAQTRQADLIYVAADNCTDRTVEIARSRPGVCVFETVNNADRKCGALNQGWDLTNKATDLYVFIDADTLLPRDAIAGWEAEMDACPEVSSVAAKFTMLTSTQFHAMAESGELPLSCLEVPDMTLRQRYWVSVQRQEFGKWADAAMRRPNRWTNVIGGCACITRQSVIEEVISERAQSGYYGDDPTPWTNSSMVEDFELTFQMRSLGYECRVSATVRAYTGTMMSLRELWAQRMKWQVGTVADLRQIGFQKLTHFDWYQQGLGFFTAICRLAWILLITLDLSLYGHVILMPFWYLFPVSFVAMEVRDALQIPHRQKLDLLLAVIFVSSEAVAWVRCGWVVAAWFNVLRGTKKDYWLAQMSAEGDVSGVGIIESITSNPGGEYASPLVAQ